MLGMLIWGGGIYNGLTALSTICQLSAVSSLVEETGVPGENHQPAASHRQYNVASSTPLHERDSNSQH
jgi:hypothetical protein